MNYQHPANYFKSNDVLTAPPAKITLMLFDGALRFINSAKESFSLDDSNIQKNQIINDNINKAHNILIELQTVLDLEAGGQFAKTMHGLYSYMQKCLMKANLEKNIDELLEVEKHLKPIRDSWSQMLSQNNTPAQSLTQKKPSISFSSEA